MFFLGSLCERHELKCNDDQLSCDRDLNGSLMIVLKGWEGESSHWRRIGQ